MQLEDWNDLRFILAAHREGSLTGAARALRVDQTTVSRRLRALQKRAGFALFERLRGGVLLTPAGAAFVEAAEEMERKIHDLERRTLGAEPPLEGALRITLPEILAAAWVDVFVDFKTQFPGVELTVTALDRIVNITRREADIAIRYVDSPPEHLVGRRVCQLALATFTAPDVADPGALPWIGWEADALTDRVFTTWRAKHDPAGATLIRVDSFHVLVEAVRRGLGRGILPCGAADRMQGLKRASGPDFQMPLWLLTHEDLRKVPRVRALLDHLSAWFELHRDQLEGR
ncbi:MAG: LysR family transcriptional regulator [Myxococcota bacterium]